MMAASLSRRGFLARPWERLARPRPAGRLSREGVRRAVVDLDRCVVPAGMDCRHCVDACPLSDAALTAGPEGPRVHEGCDGCGRCEDACALVNTMVAIRVRPALSMAQGEQTSWT